MKKILFSLLLVFPALSFAQVAKNNGQNGVSVASDARYVNVTGDTMSGPLTLSGSSLTVTGQTSLTTTTITSGRLDLQNDLNALSGDALRIGNQPGAFYKIGRNTATGYLNFSGTQAGFTGYAFDGPSFSVGVSTFVVAGGQVSAAVSATQPFRLRTNESGDYELRINQAYNGSDYAGQIQNISGGGSGPLSLNPNGGNVGIGTAAPASKLQIGTSLNATTNYLQIDTLAADTAGPPATGDCDAATEVGRMVLSSRYTATADNMIWVCLQTAGSTYAWWKTALTAP